MTKGNPQATIHTTTMASSRIGTLLGKYLLTDRLGHGGAGEVFLAYHQTLNIPVAVKVLRPRTAEADLYLAKQLKAEARILANLNHPHLIRVWDYEDHPETPYLVMEYVSGANLAELIQRSGRLRPDRALELICQVAEGLAVAHQHNIVHRDIKPANILITKEGMAKLADLGHAVVHRPDTVDPDNAIEAGAGTPLYMSPEQFDSRGFIDLRTDIYSLGATLYHALTGMPPFTGNSPRELMIQHSTTPLIPPHERTGDVPPAWSEVVETMMAKEPSDRFVDCRELLFALKGLKKRSFQGLEPTREVNTIAAITTHNELAQSRSSNFRVVLPAREVTSGPPQGSQGSQPEQASSRSPARILQEGIAAARAGKKEQARRLFLEVTAFDPNNESAWLWLASVAVTPQECLNCAERVLALNPRNRQARQWEEKCRDQLARATPRKCPYCQNNGTALDSMCTGCGAILNLQDIDQIFNMTPLADAPRLQALAQRCEASLRAKPEFTTRCLLALTYLNLQNFEKAIDNFEMAVRLRGSDPAFARQVTALKNRWAELQEQAKNEPPANEDDNKATILAIDDSPTVRKLVSHVLQKYGFRVITANGGLEGLEHLRKEKVGLILLDIVMPGVDGFQLCKLIRADPTTGHIPVVFLSGKEGMLTKLWARMAGSSAFVTKPFKPEELVQVVEKFCRCPATVQKTAR